MPGLQSHSTVTLWNSAISWCWFSQSSEGITPTQTIKPAAQITPGFPLNSNNKNSHNQTRNHPKEKVWNRFCSVKTKEERRPWALDIGLREELPAGKVTNTSVVWCLSHFAFGSPSLLKTSTFSPRAAQQHRIKWMTFPMAQQTPSPSLPNHKLWGFSFRNTPPRISAYESLKTKPLLPEEENKDSFCIYEGAISSSEIFHATHSFKWN